MESAKTREELGKARSEFTETVGKVSDSLKGVREENEKLKAEMEEMRSEDGLNLEEMEAATEAFKSMTKELNGLLGEKSEEEPPSEGSGEAPKS